MPDRPAKGPERWRGLGRLLPVEVRERVFEPAFADLLHDWAKDRSEREGRDASGGIRFPLRALGTFLGCIPIAVPRLLVRKGHLTPLGHAVLWSVTAAAGAVVLLMRVREAYAGP